MLGGHHLDHRRSKPVVLDLAMLNVLGDSLSLCFLWHPKSSFLHLQLQSASCFVWPLAQRSSAFIINGATNEKPSSKWWSDILVQNNF